VAAFAETLCFQVAQNVVSSYGKTLTREAARAGIGKRPLECWAIIAEMLGIDASPQELFDKTEPELQARCGIFWTLKLVPVTSIYSCKHAEYG
jgi:hypothetical protein